FSVDKSGTLAAVSTKGQTMAVTGTAGAGYLELPPQSSDVAVATDKVRLWSAADNFIISYDDNAPGGVDSPHIGFKSAVNGLRLYRFPAKGNGTDTLLLESDPDLVALADNSSNRFLSHVPAVRSCSRQ